jgi:uncharacterized protein YigE (DUF2233 family)
MTVFGTWSRMLALVFCLLAASVAVAGAEPCRPYQFDGSRFTVCVIDLRMHDLRLYWKDQDEQPYASFARLPRQQGSVERVFAMNAGMYLEDLRPAGLYIEDGDVLRPANNADGPGNFHMKPNGVFMVRAGEAAVLDTERYLAEAPTADLATQSGPMLVIDGELHHRFIPDSNSLRMRNGVGVRNGHEVLFAISEHPVNFHQFARLFRDGLGCDNALYLDGSMSSLHAPALGRSDFVRPMGPIIAAYRRQSRP